VVNYRHSDVISHEVSKLRPVALQVNCMAQELNNQPRLSSALCGVRAPGDRDQLFRLIATSRSD
jgi:hypothetical protein